MRDMYKGLLKNELTQDFPLLSYSKEKLKDIKGSVHFVYF